MNIPPVEAEFHVDLQTDEYTDVKKVIVSFSNFAKEHKNGTLYYGIRS